MQCRSMLCAVFFFIAGCASAPAPVASSNESKVTFAIRDRSYDEVWSAIERVAEQTLTIVDSNKTFGTLKATKGVLMGPWGDVVIFTVNPAHSGAEKYSVALQSINQPHSQLPTDDWAHTMVAKIKSELGQ